MVSLTTPPVLTALKVFHVPDGSTTAKNGMIPHATTTTSAGTATRARARQPGTATSTANRGRRANCLQRKAIPNSTPVADPPSSQCLGDRSAPEPDAHEVLGMKRLHDAVTGGRNGREDDHEQRFGEPATRPRRP